MNFRGDLLEAEVQRVCRSVSLLWNGNKAEKSWTERELKQQIKQPGDLFSLLLAWRWCKTNITSTIKDLLWVACFCLLFMGINLLGRLRRAIQIRSRFRCDYLFTNECKPRGNLFVALNLAVIPWKRNGKCLHMQTKSLSEWNAIKDYDRACANVSSSLSLHFKSSFRKVFEYLFKCRATFCQRGHLHFSR